MTNPTKLEYVIRGKQRLEIYLRVSKTLLKHLNKKTKLLILNNLRTIKKNLKLVFPIHFKPTENMSKQNRPSDEGQLF